MTKEHSVSYTMRSALCDMFMGYRTTLSYEYKPLRHFYQTRTGVTSTHLFSLQYMETWHVSPGNRLADDVRESASMGRFRQYGLQASAGRPVILLRVIVTLSDFRRPRKAMNILRIIGLRQHIETRTHPKQTTGVGTLIVATIYLHLIQNRYMFRSFTVLQCSHQHCVQPVASDVEVVGYL